MKIVVCVKQVPASSDAKIDPETKRIVREGMKAVLNPFDAYAVEEGVRLRKKFGGEVIALSMGPEKALASLREAVSLGVDRAVLLSDRAFGGSDTWATSYVLAEAIKTLGDFDLIVCGERATDGDTGQVGPGIAAWLDLPVATYVSKVESVADGSCRCHRLVEEGYEVLQVATPAVLTVVKEVADPRLPTLRGKQKARQLDVPTLGPAEMTVKTEWLGLNGSPTRVVKIFRPKVARQCRKVVANDEKSIEQAADELVGFLRQKELI